MFDHLGFNVSNFDRSLDFYRVALEPLGMAVLKQGEGWAMIGESDGRLWIGAFGPPATPVHIAFRASSREAVRRFHEAGLAAGGKDNGGPGIREQYAPDYYAAFVLDPDGHNIEAVTTASA